MSVGKTGEIAGRCPRRCALFPLLAWKVTYVFCVDLSWVYTIIIDLGLEELTVEWAIESK